MPRTVLGVVVVLLAACGGAPASSGGSPGSPPVPVTTAPSNAPTATAPAATPVTNLPPRSAGPVADAGALFVIGSDDQIYRYDGKSGALTPTWARSTFGPQDESGVYALGREGGAALLGWDGQTRDIACGERFIVSIVVGVGCASQGNDGVYVQLMSEASARRILPRDWGASAPRLSPDGRRVIVVRLVEPRPGPGMDPGLSALWLMEPGGKLREIYRPPARGVLSRPEWSPDGAKVTVRQTETTSASFAADGVGISTVLIDITTGASRSLGTTRSETWSSDGRLAFVRGGNRQTWWNKELWVVARDGSEGQIALARAVPSVALAPAFGPGNAIAWVSGPAMNDYNGGGYIDGLGAGDRVVIARVNDTAREIRCGLGRTAEGVSWSGDGRKLSLLCRKTGTDPMPLELWLYRLDDGTSSPLVTGLRSDALAGGFGFYGAQPSIGSVAAWSLAAR